MQRNMKTKTKKFNINPLKNNDTLARHKQLIITKSMNKEAAEGNVDQIQTSWLTYKNVVCEAAEEILWMDRTAEREVWFGEACKETTDVRNKAYKLMIQRS